MNNLPQGWIECEFENCVNKIPIQHKIKQKEYLENGLYPIIDQGHKYIGGYYNNEKFLIKINHPIVVFGDHTRCFKFVDFNFIAGADGIKILSSKTFFDEKLFYYFCLAIKFPNKGYSRHYQYLSKAMINIPPLNEQKRIVEKIESEFDKIDKGIEKLELAKEQIKQYRQSILKSAFEGKLTKQNFADDSAVELLKRINPQARPVITEHLPQGWIECELGEIATVKGGKRLPAGAKYSEIKTNFPYIRVKNFDNMTVDTTDIKYLTLDIQKKIKNYIISKEDVYISIAGSIGKVGIVPDELDNANLTENAAKIIHKINKKYLTYYLNSSSVQHQISLFTKSTTQPKLALYKIEEISIKLPPLNEQQRIVEEIEKRFCVADKVEKVVKENLEKAKQLKQSILKKAFEGRLVPQDPTDEPASILLKKIKAERDKK